MRNKKATDLLAGFAERIIHARKLRGIGTQAELAGLVGVSPDTVTKWEAARNYPRVPELHVLTQVLDVSADWLLFDNLRGLPAETVKRLRGHSR